MSARRVLALFRRVVQEIRRDRPSLALLFIAPILVTGLVTFILREGETPTVNAVIVNQAGPPGLLVASALGTAFEGQGGSATVVPDEATAAARIRDESASVAITLPVGFGSGAPATITILTNGLDPLRRGDPGRRPRQRAPVAAATAVTGRASRRSSTHPHGTPAPTRHQLRAPAIVGFFRLLLRLPPDGVSFLRERHRGNPGATDGDPVHAGESSPGTPWASASSRRSRSRSSMTWRSPPSTCIDRPAPRFWDRPGVRDGGSPCWPSWSWS